MPSCILLGDLNGDRNCDAVALQIGGTVRVFLGSGAGKFAELANAVPGGHTARNGELGDLNGDGNPDLVLVPPEPHAGLTVLRGNGAGFFSDITRRAFSQQPDGHITDLVLSVRDSGVHLLVATDNAVDQTLEWHNGTFALPQSLPFRGSIQTNAMLTGDLDLDGDTDVVTLRRETLPGLLRNATSHLSHTAISQSGRVLSLRFVPPPPTSTAFLFLGPVIPPVDLAPFGVLRIGSPALLFQFGLTPGNRELTLSFPLPANLGSGEVPLQAAFLDPLGLRIRLSNLEFAVFTDH